jgi:hypothetical protein
VRRLELVRVRSCARCGRAGAELKTPDGTTFSVPLDPVHAALLGGTADDVPALVDVVLARVATGRTRPGEVVLDLAAGRLRALVSLVRDGESDVVTCPAGEGVVFAVRGRLPLYATDEAVTHAAGRTGKTVREPGAGGGPDTLH